jgi:IS5 family transposase
LVVQPLYNWSYAQTEHFVGDSLGLRQFCRLGLDPVPHHTTLLRWANLLQPETMHGLLDRVTELARSLKVTHGRKLRIDGTVVATTIHYPTDSTLLADGVRVLSRVAQRVVRILTGQVQGVGSRRVRQAKPQARRIDATTAVSAPTAVRAERPKRYTRVLAVAHTSVRQAEHLRRELSQRSDELAKRMQSTLDRMVPLVQQVIAQTERRVLRGASVPASSKLVSLFEPHTAIVRRGTAHVPAEFGRKIVLDEVDGGLVTRYVVHVGNPPEAPELARSLGASPDVVRTRSSGTHCRPRLLHARERATRTRLPHPLRRVTTSRTTHREAAPTPAPPCISTHVPLAGRHRRTHQCAETPIWPGPLPIPRRSRHGALGRLGPAGAQPPSDQPLGGRPIRQVTAYATTRPSSRPQPVLQFLKKPAHCPGFAPEIS